MKEVAINQKYKDSVFRMLFNNKKELLSLYNAVNGTTYENVDDLEINTLDDGVFMKMKNDISFVLGFNLYEHQSTKCGNIALRFLLYVSDLLSGMVVRDDLYKSKVIHIPAPRFIVFYNGHEITEDRVLYKLSDQYEKKLSAPELELTATLININEDHNPELMNACRTLKDYSIFVGRIRKYTKTMILEEAVKRAVSECIAEGILADFLSKKRAEVIRVSVLEYNEELHLKNVYQDGYDDCAAQKDAIILEKDAVIAEKDHALAEKDNELSKDKTIIAEKDAALAKKDLALAELNDRISKLEALLADLTSKDN